MLSWLGWKFIPNLAESKPNFASNFNVSLFEDKTTKEQSVLVEFEKEGWQVFTVEAFLELLQGAPNWDKRCQKDNFNNPEPTTAWVK